MDIIWLLIKASWMSVTMAVLLGITSGGGSARLIALINTAVQTDTPEGLLVPFIGLTLLVLFTTNFSQFLLINLAQDSVYQLRLSLSQRVLSAPLRQLESLGPSRLLATLTEDVQAISNTVFIIPFLCIDVAVIGGCLVYLGWLSGWVFLAVVIFLVTAVGLVQALIGYAHRYLERARQEMDRLFQHFRTITDGIKELKLHSPRRHTFFENDLTASAKASCSYQKTALKIAAVASGGGQLLFFALVGLLIFGVPKIIPQANAVLPAYILTLTYLLGPIQSLVERLPGLANASVSIKKVDEMGLALSTQAELDTVTRQPNKSDWQTIELKQVIHTYQSEDTKHQFTVGPVNLTLRAGELVFIVGGNGSGKSTLAKLITGLYVPESGVLEVNGIPIVDTNREWYRQYFSTVFSDFYLFEQLIGTPDTSLDRQAQIYLRSLELEKKVSIENGQLSTTALSQGQRKRLALLSAYLEDRPIYLFDEWAADQDPVFREIFYTRLLAELKQRGKTVLVITHDDRFFYLADRLVKLNYGRIESDVPA
ncbi:MAG: cyclic peptide export ABC transporter [Cyanobacteria bacterium P01_A01_bin.137]